MITCPNCGEQTEGVNHNDRGWRCTNCFTRLPAKLEAEVHKKAEAKAEAEAKQAAAPVKPEYSQPYRSGLRPEPVEGLKPEPPLPGSPRRGAPGAKG